MTQPVGLSQLPDQEPGPNCGVTAVATLCSETFTKVWHIMQMDKRQNWKGRTYDCDMVRAIRILGFKETITRYDDHMKPSLSLWQFAEYVSTPNTMYLVITSGHAQILLNNMISDQAGPRRIERCKARNHRIILVMTVERDTSIKKSALDLFME